MKFKAAVLCERKKPAEYSLNEINSALDDLRYGRNAGRCLIEMGK